MPSMIRNTATAALALAAAPAFAHGDPSTHVHLEHVIAALAVAAVGAALWFGGRERAEIRVRAREDDDARR